MNYLKLIYEMPAVAAATTMIAYALPFRVTPRFVPALIFFVSMLVILLPVPVALALAMVIPAAWLLGILGVDLHGHDPLKIRLPKIRLPKTVPLQEFVTRAYPDPSEDGMPPEGDSEDEPQASQTVRVAKSFIPRL